MSKMNPTVKASWCAALRSGEYRQGTYQLRRKVDEDSTVFCCLGVLCEISPHEYEGRDQWLPRDVQQWAGLDKNSPRLLLPDSGRVSIDVLNDDYGLSFNQLADMIEAHL